MFFFVFCHQLSFQLRRPHFKFNSNIFLVFRFRIICHNFMLLIFICYLDCNAEYFYLQIIVANQIIDLNIAVIALLRFSGVSLSYTKTLRHNGYYIF